MDASAEFAAAVAHGPSRVVRRLAELCLLMRLDRPIGTWLLLWPTLWALWIAAAAAVCDLRRRNHPDAQRGLHRQ
jgi:hypothetical protein